MGTCCEIVVTAEITLADCTVPEVPEGTYVTETDLHIDTFKVRCVVFFVGWLEHVGTKNDGSHGILEQIHITVSHTSIVEHMTN